MNQQLLIYNVQKNTGIAVANKLEVKDPDGGCAIAMKKNSPELLAEVNKTLKKLKDEKKVEQFIVDANKLAE